MVDFWGGLFLGEKKTGIHSKNQSEFGSFAAKIHTARIWPWKKIKNLETRRVSQEGASMLVRREGRFSRREGGVLKKRGGGVLKKVCSARGTRGGQIWPWNECCP